jgi:hypothetical protein
MARARLYWAGLPPAPSLEAPSPTVGHRPTTRSHTALNDTVRMTWRRAAISDTTAIGIPVHEHARQAAENDPRPAPGSSLPGWSRMPWALQVMHRHTALLPPLISRRPLHPQDLASRTRAVIDINGGIRIHHQRLVGIELLRMGWLRDEQRHQEYDTTRSSVQTALWWRKACAVPGAKAACAHGHFIGPFWVERAFRDLL